MQRWYVYYDSLVSRLEQSKQKYPKEEHCRRNTKKPLAQNMYAMTLRIAYCNHAAGPGPILYMRAPLCAIA